MAVDVADLPDAVALAVRAETQRAAVRRRLLIVVVLTWAVMALASPVAGIGLTPLPVMALVAHTSLTGLLREARSATWRSELATISAGPRPSAKRDVTIAFSSGQRGRLARGWRTGGDSVMSQEGVVAVAPSVGAVRLVVPHGSTRVFRVE